MRIKPLAILLVVLALPTAATATSINNGGSNVNKDLVNLGPPAYDLAIVLEGTDGAGEYFNGYQDPNKGPVGWFLEFSTTIVNGNTVIHWQYFDDGAGLGDSKIDNGQKIHVGYSAAANRKVVDMFFTDKDGKRIVGSVVKDVWTGIIYQRNRITVSLENAQLATVSLKDVRYAVLSDVLPLDQLSGQNAELTSALLSLSSDLEISPGETVTLELPVSVPEGSAVVIAYEVNAEGSGASVVNYIETIAISAPI